MSLPTRCTAAGPPAAASASAAGGWPSRSSAARARAQLTLARDRRADHGCDSALRHVRRGSSRARTARAAAGWRGEAASPHHMPARTADMTSGAGQRHRGDLVSAVFQSRQDTDVMRDGVQCHTRCRSGTRARTRRVAEQRVKPDVHGLAGVARDGDAPRDGRARDAEVAQPAAHPAEHLVAPRGRLHKLGVALYQLLRTRPVLVRRLLTTGLLISGSMSLNNQQGLQAPRRGPARRLG